MTAFAFVLVALRAVLFGLCYWLGCLLVVAAWPLLYALRSLAAGWDVLVAVDRELMR